MTRHVLTSLANKRAHYQSDRHQCIHRGLSLHYKGVWFKK